ncbi:MAG: pyridoxal-phosphate dependent enzyme [Granulosicoccus sp.]
MSSVVGQPTDKPSIAVVQQVAESLTPYIVRTPTVLWPDQSGPVAGGSLYIKLELLQRTGSFKPRGAVNTILHWLRDNNANASAGTGPGVTAFSAGNHAIATAYAAKHLGVSAKVVMPRTANPFRVDRCRSLGAEVVFGENINDLIHIVDKLQAQEGRMLIHPFEGQHTIEGTATVGLELCQDIADLDVVIVPVGGGGLIAGIASVVKQLQPDCRIIGVEPTGAQGMRQSIEAGVPMEKVEVNTIADSLGAPMHAPLSFALVQQHVEQLVQVTDDQMRQAMRRMFTDMKLAVEPACAAGLAALLGPLAGTLDGKRVAMIACGSNIDIASYSRMVA